jgi:Uma2 family endonuclease
MTATIVNPVPTMADVAAVLAGLGGVPPERIWMTPTPGTATEADVIRVVESADKRLVELVDGTLVEKTVGQRESRLAVRLAGLLDQFCQLHDIGWVSGPDGMARMSEGNVREPDVSVFPWSMYPDGIMPREKVASVAPQLAVEILSESNTVAEIAKKLREYFASGTTLAWVIDPEKCIAKVYTAATTFTTLEVTGVLDGGEVVPGFRCPLAALFAAGEQRSARKKAP